MRPSDRRRLRRQKLQLPLRVHLQEKRRLLFFSVSDSTLLTIVRVYYIYLLTSFSRAYFLTPRADVYTVSQNKKLSYRRGTARCVDASCQLKSCQLPRNSAETCTTKSCCRQRLTICAINYSGRTSEFGGIINLVDRPDDSPVYHALSVHLSRAKLITRFDDRYAVAKYSKSRVWSKIPEGSTLIFKGT